MLYDKSIESHRYSSISSDVFLISNKHSSCKLSVKSDTDLFTNLKDHGIQVPIVINFGVKVDTNTDIFSDLFDVICVVWLYVDSDTVVLWIAAETRLAYRPTHC